MGLSDPHTVKSAVEISILPGNIRLHVRVVHNWRILQQIRLGLSTSKGTKPVRSLDMKLKSSLITILQLLLLL